MDIYKEVTDRIMAQLENGIIPWQKPWIASGSAVSHVTGKAYSLLNQMLLGKPGEYLTFAQCQKEGGHIRKGEKASMVVFWKFIEQEDEETHEKKQVPFLRYYSVFHIDQCEGLKAKHQPELPNTANADEAAENIIAAYIQKSGVRLSHERGDRAYYQPSTDRVVLPTIEQFAETAEYYSTAFHELTHSTGHASRLNRLEKTAFFGTEAYSKEELIAEIGAATLVQHVGLETSGSFRNSAAYIQNWLKVLSDDKRFIVSAAGKAEKAVALILGE
ncbi:MAG: ArdC family protein [Faecousia sp.]